MSAKLAGKRNHKSAGAAFDYEIKEQKALGFSDRVALYRGDGQFVAFITKKQFVAIARGTGLNGEKLRRRHPRAGQGDLLSFSLPDTVRGAMKLEGLLDTPQKAFDTLRPGLRAGMKEANKQAFGRTTGGKLVKGDLLYAVFAGSTNRAGELCPGFSVWLFPTVRAANGKQYALHNPPLFNHQKAIQGAWHLGVAHTLRTRAGIVCGPSKNSFTVRNIKVKGTRKRQMRSTLRAAKTNGPRARANAATSSRGPKQVTTWGEAWSKLTAAATGSFTKAVTAWSEERQAKLARRCVQSAFSYCNENTWRYTQADAYATAAHLALPNVRPDIFDREFTRLAARPERLGASVAKSYPNGGVLYESAAHTQKAEAAAFSLWALERKPAGGLTPKQVSRALAGSGCTARHYAAVQRLAGNGQAVLDPAAVTDPVVLRALTAAYRHSGGDVYAVGADAGRALGAVPFSATGLAETLTRTSHLRSLWRGLRTPGTLDHKLWVAEQVRANGHTKLKKGSLVVVSVSDTRDAGALARIAEQVRRAGGKLVVTGPGASEFAALGQTQAQKATGQRLRGMRP